MVKGSNENFLKFYDARMVSEFDSEEKFHLLVPQKFIETEIPELEYKSYGEGIVKREKSYRYTSYMAKIMK